MLASVCKVGYAADMTNSASTAIVERLRRYFPPPTQRTVAVEVALLQEAADHIEYQNWCMDRAIDLIESGREWDAEATLRAALGNGRSAE